MPDIVKRIEFVRNVYFTYFSISFLLNARTESPLFRSKRRVYCEFLFCVPHRYHRVEYICIN